MTRSLQTRKKKVAVQKFYGLQPGFVEKTAGGAPLSSVRIWL